MRVDELGGSQKQAGALDAYVQLHISFVM
jgi:hypothetical protein